MVTRITIRHWLPIITFCPVNNLPDLLYVTVEFELYGDDFVELYAVRKRIRKELSGRTIFMEQAAQLIAAAFPQSCSVTVRLACSRHVVSIGAN